MAAVTIAELRTYLKAGTGVTDATLTQVLAATNGVVTPLLVSTATGSEDPVRELVLAVAAQVWRNRDAGGTVTDYGDMTVTAGTAVNSSLLRRYYVLAMPYLNVAGWVG